MFDSFSSNDPFTKSPTNIWSTANNSTPLQQNLHSFSMASKNSSFSSNDDDESQKFKIVEVIFGNWCSYEHQFETNNESYESFMTNPYSMTDIKNKESSTDSSTSIKSTNENLHKYNSIIQKKLQDINAFNEFLLYNKFDIEQPPQPLQPPLQQFQFTEQLNPLILMFASQLQHAMHQMSSPIVSSIM
jgi:hypothetical protein